MLATVSAVTTSPGAPLGSRTPPTPRTAVRRTERGRYDAETVGAVLDEALVCHVGFVVDGQPYAIPTIHCRIGDTLYLHGAHATRMMRHMRRGEPVCVTATIVDGLVLARSWFHHAVNYRSVVVLGIPRVVDDPEERASALDALMEHVAPGRRCESRPPTETEVTGTAVVALGLDEASAKIRTGPPNDEEADLDLDHWAGELPLSIVSGEPVPDPRLAPGVAVPPSVRSWTRVP